MKFHDHEVGESLPCARTVERTPLQTEPTRLGELFHFAFHGGDGVLRVRAVERHVDRNGRWYLFSAFREHLRGYQRKTQDDCQDRKLHGYQISTGSKQTLMIICPFGDVSIPERLSPYGGHCRGNRYKMKSAAKHQHFSINLNW